MIAFSTCCEFFAFSRRRDQFLAVYVFLPKNCFQLYTIDNPVGRLGRPQARRCCLSLLPLHRWPSDLSLHAPVVPLDSQKLHHMDMDSRCATCRPALCYRSPLQLYHYALQSGLAPSQALPYHGCPATHISVLRCSGSLIPPHPRVVSEVVDAFLRTRIPHYDVRACANTILFVADLLSFFYIYISVSYVTHHQFM